jgi:glycosyltransferase involved in cell wall biosynthesis
LIKSKGAKNISGPIALLISLYFPPEPGGGAITALNRALILRKIGYQVFVLCGFPSYPLGRINETKYKGKFFCVEEMGDLTLIRLRLLPLKSKGLLRRFIIFLNFNFLTLLWMPRVLRISLNTQIVYALAPILFSSVIGFLYSKVTKSLFIYEVSAFWPEELKAFKNRGYIILLQLGKIFAKISYIIPDMLVVISQNAEKYVTEHYHTKRQIHVMPIGVDPNRYPPRTKEYSRKELIRKNILPEALENKFIVLYAGVITRVTKVDNIFYAADKLNNNQDDIAFLVIGEGEEKERLEEFRRVKGLNNLFLLPFQDIIMVPYIISAADLCVVPLSAGQIYETTIPTKFFDYLACNKPQIGICGGELADIINTNKIGVTVKDGEIYKLVDTIIYLKDSPLLLKCMEKNTNGVLQMFSLDTLATKLKEVLKKRLGKRYFIE